MVITNDQSFLSRFSEKLELLRAMRVESLDDIDWDRS